MKDANRNGIVDRNASSPRRETDVKITKWPVITLGAYQAMLSRKLEGEDVNAKTRALCIARIRLGQSILALQQALKETSARKDTVKNPRSTPIAEGDQAIHGRLEAIEKKIQEQFMRFPLEIVK